MLLELKVANFAIINSLEVSFQDGLNILSGETGAGKSVVLKSLALLMGEKADSEAVRSGHDQATVQGLFDLGHRPDVLNRLNDMGIATDENTLVVQRVVTTQGKSKVFLNGHLSALQSLRDVVAPLITVTGHGAPLIEMTGQHDNRHLQSRQYHLDLLDHYGGALTQRQTYTSLFERRKVVLDEMARLESEARTRTQRLDFLVFQRDEIKALGLSPGEEEQLESSMLRLKHATRLAEFASEAQHALYGDEDAVTVRLHHLLSRGIELASADPSLGKRLEPLAQAKSLIEDVVYDLRDYGRSLNAQPEELNVAEERISQLRRLQKKFGSSVAEILQQLESIESEIARLESSDSDLEKLAKEKSQIERELLVMAAELHKRRENAAHLLAQTINGELADLNMKGVKFGVSLARLPELVSTGHTDVEFTIQASKKDEPRPLAKFASGGELSRILLALKRVVGHSDLPRTYLFDEVDTGVSGETAEKVGRKLKSISQGQQVICVTHLPQVAAFADAHYVIEKGSGKSGVEMKVARLNKADRVREIARLISGEKISATSMNHAKQLLSDCQ